MPNVFDAFNLDASSIIGIAVSVISSIVSGIVKLMQVGRKDRAEKALQWLDARQTDEVAGGNDEAFDELRRTHVSYLASLELTPSKHYVIFPLFHILWPLAWLGLALWTTNPVILAAVSLVIIVCSMLSINYFIYSYAQRQLVRWCIYEGVEVTPEQLRRGVPTALVSFPIVGAMISLGFYLGGSAVASLFKPDVAGLELVFAAVVALGHILWLSAHLATIRKDMRTLARAAKEHDGPLTEEFVQTQARMLFPRQRVPVLEKPSVRWLLTSASKVPVLPKKNPTPRKE